VAVGAAAFLAGMLVGMSVPRGGASVASRPPAGVGADAAGGSLPRPAPAPDRREARPLPRSAAPAGRPEAARPASGGRPDLPLDGDDELPPPPGAPASAPGGTAELVAAFRRAEGERLGVIAALLGERHEPAVEALAVDLARTGDRAHRLAALAILDAFETPAAIPVVSEILAAERDPEILQAALYALPDGGGMGVETAEALDRDLRRLAAEGEPETRRRALRALGSWGTAADDATLVGALRGDRDPAVRAAAAFALEQRRGGGEEGIRTLAEVVSRRDEDRDVRENAWQALRRAGPLPPAARAAYDAYAAEREGEPVR
jgi:HEAT repeat protein